jgi:hypothetical protein
MRVVIADVKVPFPCDGFVDRTHTANVMKYTALKEKFERHGYSTELYTIIIPSVGPNLKFSHSALTRIGFKTSEANKILRNMSGAAAKENAKLQGTLRVLHPGVQPAAQLPALLPDGPPDPDVALEAGVPIPPPVAVPGPVGPPPLPPEAGAVA